MFDSGFAPRTAVTRWHSRCTVRAEAMKTLTMLLAFALSACVIDNGDPEPPSGPGSSSSSSTYENHVKLECNGNVLVDRTFTSKDSCESFRDGNTFYCAGVKLAISC